MEMFRNFPYYFVCRTADSLMHPEVSAAGHLDTRFLVFLSLKLILKLFPSSKFQVSTESFSCSSSDVRLSKLSTVSFKAAKIIFSQNVVQL
jgi:hypothetical protein